MMSKLMLIASALIFFACGQKKVTSEQGPMGPQGEQGEQGLPGKNGKDGKDGKNGENGKDGYDGKKMNKIANCYYEWPSTNGYKYNINYKLVWYSDRTNDVRIIENTVNAQGTTTEQNSNSIFITPDDEDLQTFPVESSRFRAWWEPGLGKVRSKNNQQVRDMECQVSLPQ